MNTKKIVWGAATASYQIEGAWNEDGKGLSIWDVFTHEPSRIWGGHTGDMACDHYHRFREDVKLMKELGIQAYRFSISWARLFPNGIGEVNDAGVRFYSDLIDALLDAGIEPYITLYHWDLPYELHKKGGWLNEESISWFAQYAAKVTELYSDRVKYFITFNEPACFVGNGYFSGVHAPGLKVTYKDLFQIAHNVLKAHGAAVIAMRKSAVRPIKIGFAPNCNPAYPITDSPADIEAARIKMFTCPPLGDRVLFNVAWWSDPVILGRYPEEGLKMYRDYLPEITEEDMKLISQPIDFYGQNIYSGDPVHALADGEPEYLDLKPGNAKTAIQWPITPECMYWGPKFLYERYGLPVVITENGMSAHDMVSLDGKVHDPNRIDFMERYMTQLERAAKDGADIQGYFAWSFMDNFEWACGYAERFGLVYVDYETQQRIPKDSAWWYKEWIQQHS